jgi:hypothetical protein
MLGAAIRTAEQDGRAVRVVTPTKKAAEVAAIELGVPTDSVAALVHAHGFRWNADGVWTRLAVGDTDTDTGATYRGPSKENHLARGERVVVDEAGMLDQDTALALLTVADESGSTLALVGDRAQLPAVGRGGVFDIAAALTPRVFDLTSLHRFTDPDYAQLTLDLRVAATRRRCSTDCTRSAWWCCTRTPRRCAPRSPPSGSTGPRSPRRPTTKPAN